MPDAPDSPVDRHTGESTIDYIDRMLHRDVDRHTEPHKLKETFGHPADDPFVTISVRRGTLKAAVNCVRSGAADEREPSRYVEWYAEALRELELTVTDLSSELPAQEQGT